MFAEEKDSYVLSILQDLSGLVSGAFMVPENLLECSPSELPQTFCISKDIVTRTFNASTGNTKFEKEGWDDCDDAADHRVICDSFSLARKLSLYFLILWAHNFTSHIESLFSGTVSGTNYFISQGLTGDKRQRKILFKCSHKSAIYKM